MLTLILNLTDLLQQTASLNAKNVTVCTQSNIANLVTNLISNMMRVFIPFTVMLILNLLVIWNLNKSKPRVGAANVAQIASQLLQNNQNGRQISNRQFRFMVSTLIVDFMYLIFYLPIAVSLTVRTYDMFRNSFCKWVQMGFSIFILVLLRCLLWDIRLFSFFSFSSSIGFLEPSWLFYFVLIKSFLL